MITLRKISEAEIPAIQAIANVAFPATYKEILTPGQLEYMMEWMYSTESLKNQMTSGHCYHLAETDGKAIGYVSFNREEGALFHLQKIYVLPEYQGTGIGKALFEKVVEQVRSLGGTAIEVNVNRTNNAKTFYEHMGMTVARTGDFPIGNGYYMNDYIMRLEL